MGQERRLVRTVVGIIELLVLVILAVVVAMLCQRVTRIEHKINLIGSPIGDERWTNELR